MRVGLYEARLMLSAVAKTTASLPAVIRPHVATVNLTENCQCRCIMCDYWKTSARSPISEERAKTLVDEVRTVGVRTLRLLGGEPLLRKDLFSVLRHAAPLGFTRVVLATNGLLLDRFAEDVNNSCITNLTVSVDGLAENNDVIRGVPGYFDCVMNNLALIRGKRIKLGALFTSRLAEDIHGLIDLCQKRGYSFDVNLPSFDLPYAISEEAQHSVSELWPTPNQVELILDAMIEAGFVTNSLADACREYLVNRRYPFKRCLHGFVSLLIRANGDLTLGCYEKEPVGNVIQESIPEILGSAFAHAEAKSMFRLECNRCICGWQVSHVLAHPGSNVRYVRSRLRRPD